jgi:predicted DNA-binding transcriptional regulator AlpA
MQESADDLVAQAVAAGLLKPGAKRGVKLGSKRTKRPSRPLPEAVADDEVLLTTEEACVFFGGPSRPIHPATLYRNIGGRYPRPVSIGPNSVRWLLSECRLARQKFIDARDKAA